ncbi:MAG: hypothetical protein DI629_02750 [Mesorhizobium amorphae]|nr:MAG: hypothetical protein DI629_02750 [Mesorhizobium amorphae]
MIRQSHSVAREALCAEMLAPVVAELRLIDAADYVAFIRLEQFAALSDLVASAAELYFMPGTVRLGHGGHAHCEWGEPPRVVLDLELRPRGATVWLSLVLEAERAGIELAYVSFEKAGGEPEVNTAFLARALDEARIRRTEPVAL